MIDISDFIASWNACPFARHGLAPWQVTSRAPELVRQAIGELGAGYSRDEDRAVHDTAIVEPGAIIKGPAILGPGSFVAAGAYLRGGVALGEGCIVGPACEVKTTIMFAGSKVAHLSFVGDSIIGADVNIEAGAIIANYRNEMDDKRIRIWWQDSVLDTGVEKFGALIGDHVRIGANAVIAPGALIAPGFRLTRLGKVDQHPHPLD
jgi:UDP-N-acetylglucosamine diphosphorylase / glucose-1-phosphate thymidylyltransferase / UDP-N-acetylgalactosamine diphosphorylase / glucosamine-1-phosphate N-acetyltransferase / galactosamine-1-phosphate N-acetyltransferase